MIHLYENYVKIKKKDPSRKKAKKNTRFVEKIKIKFTSLKSEQFRKYLFILCKNYLSITLSSKEAFATKSEP